MGDPTPSPEYPEMPDFFDQLGWREANRVLKAVHGVYPDIPPLRDLNEFGATLRKLFGPIADRLGRLNWEELKP
jgi:hypothetical protein